jgi:hypothetical protein
MLKKSKTNPISPLSRKDTLVGVCFSQVIPTWWKNRAKGTILAAGTLGLFNALSNQPPPSPSLLDILVEKSS